MQMRGLARRCSTVRVNRGLATCQGCWSLLKVVWRLLEGRWTVVQFRVRDMRIGHNCILIYYYLIWIFKINFEFFFTLLKYGNFCLASARLSFDRQYLFTYYFQSSFGAFLRAVSYQFQSNFREFQSSFFSEC